MKKDFSKLSRQIHLMPDFMEQAIAERGLMGKYLERPPYQQNDYIAWIEQAKKQATRERRLNQMLDELEAGGVYMKMTHSGSLKK
ncbi:MAG: YdeI/OmpD-associated family protein [Deltaproteobacteria bacterium]|jgi:uncharacterized protein YdeI (YjbR/CyaY-like superfamily)|nr:YdeI/OmpD-associated family protein [Deltaproteobacteria bacterium]